MDTLELVKRKLRLVPGLVDLKFLSDDEKKKIIELEKRAEDNGAAGGLMAFTNEGVWESLNRSFVVLLVMEHEKEVLNHSTPVKMVDENGQVLGEYMREGEVSPDREDVCFLSDDFVIYSDVKPEGTPYFLLPEIELPFLEDVEGIQDITSGSISTLSDHYIRKAMGYEDTDYWTHLVGFNLSG